MRKTPDHQLHAGRQITASTCMIGKIGCAAMRFHLLLLHEMSCKVHK